jgi:hypothetical protein
MRKEVLIVGILALLIVINGCNQTSVDSGQTDTQKISKYKCGRDAISKYPELDGDFKYSINISKFALEKNDPCICKVIDEEVSQADCYSKVGMAMEDETICLLIDDYNGIGEKDIRADCLAYIAKKKLNTKICDIIKIAGPSSTDKKESCITNVGFAQKLTTCGGIGDTPQRNWCYLDIARELADPSICEKIEKDDVRKSDCYKTIEALEKKDTNICSEIEIQSFREWCIQRLAE